MKLFEDFKIKFERPDWSRNLELGLIDTILEQHPHLINLLGEDITKGQKSSVFGRKDTPSVIKRVGIQGIRISSDRLEDMCDVYKDR
jgi:hypothetical protein